MKLVILAEIHGNLPALKSILDRENDADLLYCAGDLVDCGPFPGEVLDLVREVGIQCVAGNHDRRAIREFNNPELWDDLPSGEITYTRFCARLLNKGHVQFLQSLPDSLEFEADGYAYGMYHHSDGSNPIETHEQFETAWTEHFAPTDLPRRIIVGHHHIQYVIELADAGTMMNPGAVSFNRPPVPGTRYITITDGIIEKKQHPYDKRPMLEAFRAFHNLERKEHDWLLQFYPFSEGPVAER